MPVEDERVERDQGDRQQHAEDADAEPHPQERPDVADAVEVRLLWIRARRLLEIRPKEVAQRRQLVAHLHSPINTGH